MRSGKSFFNATLYKKNLTRFWPVWVLYLVIWMFVLPFDLILSGYSNSFLRFSQKHVLDTIINAGLVMAVVFALLAAVAVWSYLYNNRSACLMHTMPIRREGLFLTNFLSGMTFLAGPNLIVFVLTLLTEVLYGCVAVGPLVMWFFAVTLMELFFFCFATFCAMFTGHILALPAFYAILSGLPVGLVALLDAAFSRFVFGYDGIEGLYTLARWLTPIGNLASSLDVRRVEEVAADGINTVVHYEFPTLGYILVYAVLGLILAGIALIVYRCRHMERAGDAVTVAWVRPVFQYGVAFCCALAFGVLFFELFRGVLPETVWTLLVLMLISGAVGYFLARMILEKSFRVFFCWKGCIPFLAVLVVLVCVMEFDLTGFERKVPEEKRVMTVSISNLPTVPYDEGQYTLIHECENPDVIRQVLDLHRCVVDHKETFEERAPVGWSDVHEDGYSVSRAARTGFHVSYYLKNGDVLSRDYSGDLLVISEELDDPQTISGKINELVNLPQVIEDSYGLMDERGDDIIEMTLSGFFVYEDYEGYEDVPVSEAAYEAVLEAIKADFNEGNIGRRYLLDDEERMNNCFVNDLEIVFYRGIYDAEKRNTEPAGITVEGYSKTSPDIMTERITVTLQTTSRHTLAALEKIGVLQKPVCLLTQAQSEKANLVWEQNGRNWADVDIGRFAEVIVGG